MQQTNSSEQGRSGGLPWWVLVLGVVFLAAVLTMATMFALSFLFLGLFIVPFIWFFIHRTRNAGSRDSATTDDTRP